VDDVRESPAIKIIEIAKGYGSDVHTFDPHILGRSTEKSLEEILEKSQALILVTDHNEFKSIEPEIWKKYGIKVIIDGKNCLDKDKIRKLGIIYKGIGR
jgi:UDP-N-acetyl-D-mannosaminuronate dehydrogenase